MVCIADISYFYILVTDRLTLVLVKSLSRLKRSKRKRSTEEVKLLLEKIKLMRIGRRKRNIRKRIMIVKEQEQRRRKRIRKRKDLGRTKISDTS